MDREEIQATPWYLEPYEGESISHYFGRFRRHELVCISSPANLSKAAGIGPVLARWEKFRFNPFPTQEQLAAIGKLIGLEADRLTEMLPPKGEKMKLEPIRLCAACYTDQPYHRIEWQFQSTAGCKRHKLRLLSKCPGCQETFVIPALWEKGECQRCYMPFKTMVKRQKVY
ncbi:MAG: TniQ family protein [Nostoc sp. DedQUE08]|uniref:TniQ family protein n=1 Tax=Nostoc sp. DedQUE08 TaxID=3075393 RepID=UPI002AD4ECF5|nr:TniQ family protein [Nostoc sp. DedQUE08]MDZ8069696.1 TniQ family protein [Nostoc sp. DedQUE08]